MYAILVTDPSHGTLSFEDDGTFLYTPATGYYGADSFTYEADNGMTNSNVATVSLTVAWVNQAPEGSNNTVTTTEDTSYAFKASDFGFTDPNDTPSDKLLAVKISSLPDSRKPV